MQSKTVSIIALDHNEWYGPWMNRQQILSRLGQRGWSVVYSCGRLSAWERYTERFRHAPFLAGFERCDNVLVDRPCKLLLDIPRIPYLDSMTLRWHAAHLRGGALSNGSGLVLIVYSPTFAPYVELLNPDYLVFYLRDAYHAEPGWGAEDQARYNALVQRADLIVASQALMAEPISGAKRGRLLELPNGVDFAAFQAGGQLPEPADLAAIPGPRIGYAGRINRKVDLKLLHDLASRNADWQLVLIGPVASLGGEEKEKQWQQLLALGNVHWLGGKDAGELPAYTAAIDVHLLAYDTIAAPWMTFGSPLKLYECLAAGRPVVSAPLKTVAPVDGAVKLAASLNEWEVAIRQSLAESGGTHAVRRQAIAADNSWEGRVDVLEARLREMIGGG